MATPPFILSGDFIGGFNLGVKFIGGKIKFSSVALGRV